MVKMAGYSIAFNSSSEKLSAAVDYNCGTSDFMEVYKKITEIGEKPVRWLGRSRHAKKDR
jgi:hypothetical protein